MVPQDQLRTDTKQGSMLAQNSSKENQNSNGARFNLGPGVDLGSRLRLW